MEHRELFKYDGVGIKHKATKEKQELQLFIIVGKGMGDKKQSIFDKTEFQNNDVPYISQEFQETENYLGQTYKGLVGGRRLQAGSSSEKEELAEGKKGGARRTGSLEDWSQEQAHIIFGQYLLKGSKWSKIAECLPGRTQNSIKNKFYGTLRRTLRRINEIGKQNFKRFSKPIKYEGLIRVLEAKEGLCKLPEHLMMNAEAIRAQILEMCRNQGSLSDQQKAINFIGDLHKFNLQSRCYKLKKGHKRKETPQTSLKDSSIDSQVQDSASEPPLQSTSSKIKCKTQSVCSPNIISGRRTQQNIQILEGQEIRDIESILPCTTITNANNFEREVCEMLGIAFTPSTDLLREFF